MARAEQIFADYDYLQRSGHAFNNGDLNSMLRVLIADPKVTLRGLAEAGKQRSFGRRTVQPKSPTSGAIWMRSKITTWFLALGRPGRARHIWLLRWRFRRCVQAGEPDYPGASGGRSRRAPGISAGNFAGKDRSLFAASVRCALRHAGAREGGSLSGKERDRDCAHCVHARAHVERLFRDSGRGAKHNVRADEDVCDPTGIQLQSRDHRRHDADRSTECEAQWAAGGGGHPEKCEGLAFCISMIATWCGTIWCSASFALTMNARTRGSRQIQMDLLDRENGKRERIGSERERISGSRIRRYFVKRTRSALFCF